MKETFLVLGNGKSQVPIIEKILKKKKNLIVIDKKLKLRKNFLFLKNSIYNFNKKKIFKYFKEIKVSDIVFRSSGPAILLYSYLCSIKLKNKVGVTLAKSIYSKSFLEKILKSKKIQTKPPYSMLQSNRFVIKPDAPLIGKKYVYSVYLNQISKIKKKFKNDNISHNKKFNIQKELDGFDISIFFFKHYRNEKTCPLLYLQEFNKFSKSGKLNHLGTCSPPIHKISNKLKKKIDLSIKKMNFLFKDYYGCFSISLKVNENDFYIYELNVGLLGDSICEVFFPHYYQNDIYNIEIFNKLKKQSIIKKKRNGKFIGIWKKEKILNKKTFLKKMINAF